MLCGDLNAPPARPSSTSWWATTSCASAGSPSEPTHSLLGRRLDYIFSDPRFEVLDAKVLRAGPSDHWPVWRGWLAWRVRPVARHRRSGGRLVEIKMWLVWVVIAFILLLILMLWSAMRGARSTSP